MIWIYLTFLFLFFNELGFIGYQTYLYNVMCMDLLIEGDFSDPYGEIEFICLELGTVNIEISEVDSLWELEPYGLGEGFLGKTDTASEVVYHINFSSQVYPSCDELYFQVLQRHIYTAPGDLTLVFFHMENMSDQSYSGVTIYTISPFYLSYYVQKIQCFCFEELQIQGHQSLELPVIFYLDPLMDNANWYSLTVEYIFLFTS
jgi:hypothetical protein